MTDELEQLREEVAQLRRDLYGEAEALQVYRVMMALRATPQEARVALILWSRRGETVTRRTILAAVWESRWVEEKILDVIVCKLRKKGLTIRNNWAMGYGLEPDAVGRMDQALAGPHRDELLAYLHEPRMGADVARFQGVSGVQAVATLRALSTMGLVARGVGGAWKVCAPPARVGLA